MTGTNQKQLGNTLWGIADTLRGAMNADDYMLSFLFLRYLSDNYETATKKELGKDYPTLGAVVRRVPLSLWYANNPDALIAAQAQKLDPLKTDKKGLMQQIFPSPEAVQA